MTTRFSYNANGSNNNSNNNSNINVNIGVYDNNNAALRSVENVHRSNYDDDDEAAVLYTSIHPFHNQNNNNNPRPFESRLSAAMSGAATSGSAAGEDQRTALLMSHVGVPSEITDSIQSWVDVQESIDEAMRESPIPGGRLSAGSSSAGGAGTRGTAASFSGAATPSSLARLTFLHASSERLLQAVDSPTPSRSGRPSSMVLLQSPVYIDSPTGLMSVHSQSPPPEDEEEEEEEEAEKKNVNSSVMLERLCFDRVNAAAACLNSQVESGVIESEKVVNSSESSTKAPNSGGGEIGDWVWDWSSRPESTPPKSDAAQYSRGSGKRTSSTSSSRQHRKTHPTSFRNAFLWRLEVFSAENLPVLLVSHACSVLLGAALMLFYIKRR